MDGLSSTALRYLSTKSRDYSDANDRMGRDTTVVIAPLVPHSTELCHAAMEISSSCIPPNAVPFLDSKLLSRSRYCTAAVSSIGRVSGTASPDASRPLAEWLRDGVDPCVFT